MIHWGMLKLREGIFYPKGIKVGELMSSRREGGGFGRLEGERLDGDLDVKNGLAI